MSCGQLKKSTYFTSLEYVRYPLELELDEQMAGFEPDIAIYTTSQCYISNV